MSKYKKHPPSTAKHTHQKQAPAVTPAASATATPSQSRSQRLARSALDQVNAVVGSDWAADYKSRALNFPTQLLQSGLAQSIGFLAAKSGDSGKSRAYQQYFNDVARVAGLGQGQALLVDALKADLPRYRLLTRDVLDAATWLKRFAQSQIKDKTAVGSHGA